MSTADATQSETEVAAVYSATADVYADRFPATEPEQPVDLAMVSHFVSLLPAPAPEVLDAGCGAGRMLPVLAAAGCRVVGVDLSPGMVRRARHDHPEFEIQVGSLTSLPHLDASFDAVFCWYSTIHLPDHRLGAAFGEVRRVLRPGGHVLVAFQTGEGVRDVSAGIRRLGFDVTLLRHHRTPDVMGQTLTRHGFTEVARMERAPIPPESDGQAVLIARTTPAN